MGVELSKDSVDLGIVVKDIEGALRFYRDTLGLPYEAKLDMPGGMTMHRLACGSSVIKLLELEREPPASAPPGGITGAYGYRYWTISVSNLAEVTEAAERAGFNVVVAPREIRPGITISIIEDPDGNWVELLQG